MARVSTIPSCTPWKTISDISSSVFPTDLSPIEAHTEDDLIWPVLGRLGWTAYLRQQKLSTQGKQDIPDGLLFENEEEKARAIRVSDGAERYEFGLAMVESKRWERPLDRRSGSEESEPSPQMPLDFAPLPRQNQKTPRLGDRSFHTNATLSEARGTI